MVKLIITGRRRAGLTRAGLSHHLRRVHGPMVVSPPADAGAMPGGYVQNHVFDGSYPSGEHPAPIDRDFVTELWFDSPRAAGESVGTPYYRTVLQPDEPRFVSQASVLRCFAEEEEVRAAASPGQRKAFLFLRQSGGQSGADDAAFQAAWRAARAAALGGAHAAIVQRWVANVTRAVPGQDRPFDGIDEIWFDGPADGATALAEAVVAGLGDAVQASGVFTLLAEEFTTARLLAQ